MSIKQIEALAAFLGAGILCAGVAVMIADFWKGAALIAGACLLIFAAGLLVRIHDRRRRRKEGPPKLPTYKAVDHDLPPWLSETELEMLRANKLITGMRWPTNPGLQHHEHPLDICREER